MKIEVDVPDIPHSRHQVSLGDGKTVFVIIPSGLTTAQELELGEKFVRFGEHLLKNKKLDS